jgi:predicted RNase H-like HicB family nuclease
MSIVELENTSGRGLNWTQKSLSPTTVYYCHICLLEEEDGSFSAIVLNLPGAGSCGKTEDEAIRNAREAISAVIASHIDAREEIPWRDVASYDIPEGGRQKWIVVDA